MILADDALQISVFDRALEHGLGLFETFRTWHGRPALLDRHLERMNRSAQALGLTLEPVPPPDGRAVFDLIDANRATLPFGADVRLRLTASGGQSGPCAGGSVLWMTAGPLRPPARISGAIVDQTIRVSQDDVLARHKTLNYWHKRIAHAEAAAAGSDDVLWVTEAGLVCETSRANIFVVEGQRLITPGLSGPLLPGVMRGLVVERAAEIGLDVFEGPLPLDRIKAADEAFLTSSLRGILPVARLLGRALAAPGPVTRRLWEATQSWLLSGGTTP